jgi:hypothetical protein
MKNNYTIQRRVTFSVLAESETEAETIANDLMPDENEYPVRALVSMDAYYTPNQSEDCKSYAVNYEPEQK